MGEDLKAQLETLYPMLVGGAKHPPYCDLCVTECYARFCNDLANRRFCDPRGTVVPIYLENFPKLLGMKIADPKSGKLRKAKASRVLEKLREGTFRDDEYVIEKGRIRTLFWIPDVIVNPDAIHPNSHPIVDGDEVYVKRYAKDGSEVKLVVLGPSKYGSRIIITSFLTEARDLEHYIGMPAIWEK